MPSEDDFLYRQAPIVETDLRGTLRFYEWSDNLRRDIDAINVTNDSKVVISVNIDSSDSPYTQVNSAELIFADASGGDIDINFLAASDCVSCEVKKTDTSSNQVTANSSDLIAGVASFALKYYNESLECKSNGSTFYT